jgi:hypothetical protein
MNLINFVGSTDVPLSLVPIVYSPQYRSASGLPSASAAAAAAAAGADDLSTHLHSPCSVYSIFVIESYRWVILLIVWQIPDVIWSPPGFFLVFVLGLILVILSLLLYIAALPIPPSPPPQTSAVLRACRCRTTRRAPRSAPRRRRVRLPAAPPRVSLLPVPVRWARRRRVRRSALLVSGRHRLPPPPPPRASKRGDFCRGRRAPGCRNAWMELRVSVCRASVCES